MDIAVRPLGVRESDEFDQAFTAMNNDMPDANLMVSDQLTVFNRKRVFEFLATHRLPVVYEAEFYVSDGGLMSYGPDVNEARERVAALTGRRSERCGILRPAVRATDTISVSRKPQDRTTHDLTISPMVFTGADEVIE